jgi:hypothetical protein
MHVPDTSVLIQQVEQQGCRDVVGQVADDAQEPVIVQRAKVEPQGIAVVDCQFTCAGTQTLQRFHKVPVEFNDGEPADLLQQRQGDGSPAGPDLDDGVILHRLYGRYDPGDHNRVVQEVLAEPFPWTVSQGVILALVIVDSQLQSG